MMWDSRSAMTPTTQGMTVSVRDPSDDTELAVIFQTSVNDPQVVSTMTNYTADVSAFAGQTVRIDVSISIQDFYCIWAFDSFRFTAI